MNRRQFLAEFALTAAGLYAAPKLIFDMGKNAARYAPRLLSDEELVRMMNERMAQLEASMMRNLHEGLLSDGVPAINGLRDIVEAKTGKPVHPFGYILRA